MGTDCGLPSTQLTGEEAVAVRIRVYNATGHFGLEQSNILMISLPICHTAMNGQWRVTFTGSHHSGLNRTLGLHPHCRRLVGVLSSDYLSANLASGVHTYLDVCEANKTMCQQHHMNSGEAVQGLIHLCTKEIQYTRDCLSPQWSNWKSSVTMKALVALMGLITVSLLSGGASFILMSYW